LKYMAKHNCSICHQAIFYDDETKIMECKCGKIKIIFINTEDFISLNLKNEKSKTQKQKINNNL